MLVGREQLKLAIWGTANVSDNSIDQKIAELRKVFAQVDPATEYIQNKHGQGWRFVVPVENRAESDTQAPAKAPRRGWSKMVYAAVAAGVAIAAGAVMKIEGVRGSEPHITGYRQLTNDGFPKEGRILTDGRLVYFTEHISYNANSDARLAAVSAAGGEVVYPPTPVQPAILLDVAARTGDRLYSSGKLFDAGPMVLWRSKEGSLEPAGARGGEAAFLPTEVFWPMVTGIVTSLFEIWVRRKGSMMFPSQARRIGQDGRAMDKRFDSA